MTDKGFRVTVEDLDTGDNQTMVVHAGDYMLIPFAPCYLHYTQRSASGTVQIMLKGHSPQGRADREEDTRDARRAIRLARPIDNPVPQGTPQEAFWDAEKAATRTYHPLAGDEAAMVRHPGMLTRCLDPACMTAAAALVPVEQGAEDTDYRTAVARAVHAWYCESDTEPDSSCAGLADAVLGVRDAEVVRLREALTEHESALRVGRRLDRDTDDSHAREVTRLRAERDAHVHTLDHVLEQLHVTVGGLPEDASLATFPDALEQVEHLRAELAEATADREEQQERAAHNHREALRDA